MRRSHQQSCIRPHTWASSISVEFRRPIMEECSMAYQFRGAQAIASQLSNIIYERPHGLGLDVKRNEHGGCRLLFTATPGCAAARTRFLTASIPLVPLRVVGYSAYLLWHDIPVRLSRWCLQLLGSFCQPAYFCERPRVRIRMLTDCPICIPQRRNTRVIV
jgi:hypothetical protein